MATAAVIATPAIRADIIDSPDPVQQPQKNEAVIVSLPTLTVPSYEQKVIGKKSCSAAVVEEFRGIPYGIVPARWQHSLLRTSLPEDVFDASRNGPRCPQPQEPNNTNTFQAHLDFPSGVDESEFDCLNLFIVRPSAAALTEAGFDIASDGLPVYFYIHGGGYGFGAGTDPMWNPTRLVARSLELRKPMIAVAINYRLNLFGFAASSDIVKAQSDSEIRGCNFGLGDQRTALKWVSQNISSFGGDPSRITIGGQSAGAISVHAHVLEAKYGLGQPLFRRAVVQSAAMGTLGPLSLTEADARWEMLCKYLNISMVSAGSRLALLSSIPPSELVKAAQELGWMLFPLVVDGTTINTRADGRWKVCLGPKDTEPADRMQEESAPVCVLIGDTDVEASIYYRQISKIKNFEQVQTLFQAACLSTSISHAILNHYGLAPELPISVLRDRILLFLTDVEFGYPVQCAREELSSHESVSTTSREPRAEGRYRPESSSPRLTSTQTYRVQFGNPFAGISHKVAHHCVDLIYIFDCFYEYLNKADRDTVHSDVRSNQDLVQEMQSQWIAFISDNDVADDQDDLATVYGPDRRKEVVSIARHPEWVERRQRFKTLARHWQESATAAKLFASIDRD